MRQPTSSETALLHAFLAHEFPGVDELRVQAAQVTVSGGCACGCGTIELHVPDGLPRSSADSPAPVEGTALGVDGEPVGGLLLFITDGRLSCLEVYPLDDAPVPLPAPERVRWHP